MANGLHWEGYRLGRGMLHVDRILSVIAVLAATLCAVLHVVLMLEMPGLSSLVMLFVALPCFACAWHGLRHPGAAMWAWMAAASLTMLAVHLFAHGSPHHGGGGQAGAASASAAVPSAAMNIALSMTYVELFVSLLALVIGGVAMRRVSRRERALVTTLDVSPAGDRLSERVGVLEQQAA